MSTVYSGKDITLETAEDLSNDKYRIVVLTSAGTVRRPDSSTEVPFGILQNAPDHTNNKSAVVRISGTSLCVAGETIAVGEYVKLEYNSASDAGKALDADAENDQAIGQCTAGGAEDDYITLEIGRQVVNIQTEVT